MIIGIGNDLIDIRRIERTLARFGDRFVARVFSDTERSKAERRRGAPRGYASTLAKRFAAKEAAAKALGTGFRKGVFWRDLAVVNLPSGQPTIAMTGGAQDHLRSLVPTGMEPRVHLTMTDEWPMAEAQVIISAVPVADDHR